jgi:hypothetical protein
MPSTPDTPGQSSTGSEGSDGGSGWLEDIESASTDDWQTSNAPVADESTSAQNAGTGAQQEQEEASKSAAEEELDGALKDFDGEILAERGALKKSAANNPTPTTPTIPAKQTSTDAEESGNPSSAAKNQRAQIPNRPPPPKKGGQSLPTDIPDAKDDDIISRQLREAAMQEIDPTLKEKLWAEYKRYKKG